MQTIPRKQWGAVRDIGDAITMPDETAADSNAVTITDLDSSRVAQLRAELEHLHANDVIKDIWKKTEARLKQTHYYWWWEFVRTGVKNQQLLDEITADAVKASELTAVRQDFEADDMNFENWWEERGRALFQENTVPHIDPIGVKVVEKNGFSTPIVFIAVPLSISKDLLLEQFKLVLDSYFPENFMRHAASTAQRRIEPSQKDREFDYGYLLEVWNVRTSNPNLPFWKVHCKAKGDDKQLKELEVVGSASAKQAAATRKAQQAYNQADELMRNALIGQFPKDDQFQKKKRGGATSAKKKSKKEKQQQ